METRTGGDKELHVSGSGEEGPQLPKIVAISVPFPGAKRPLEEGAKLGWWDLVLLKEERINIPPAELYTFGAWHPIYEHLMNLPGKKGVLWTSSVGEVDFEPREQEYLRWLIGDPRIDFIWFGDLSLAKAFPEKGFYASYPLVYEDKRSNATQKCDMATLFCPSGYKKNILNQLIAMQLVQQKRELVLHTNIDDRYNAYLSNIKHERHGWLSGMEYENLIGSAKINLAVSFAETFNYQVAEALMLGTPSVISSTVPMPGHLVENPNNPAEIAESIDFEMDFPGTKNYLETLHNRCTMHNDLTKRTLADRLKAF